MASRPGSPSGWQTRSAAPPPTNRTPLLLGVSALVAVLGLGGVVIFSRSRATDRPGPAPDLARVPGRPNPPEVAGREEQHHHGAPAPVAPVAPPAAPPGAPAPTLRTRLGWLSSVHYHSPRGVDLHPGDLDGADGRCVRLTRAMLTLELPGGSQFVSDGNAQGSDLEVRVESPGSGSFDLEIGVGHNRFVPVEGDLSGDQTIDLDHLGVRLGRFVRISTRRTGASVCVDAVSVHRAVPGSP